MLVLLSSHSPVNVTRKKYIIVTQTECRKHTKKNHDDEKVCWTRKNDKKKFPLLVAVCAVCTHCQDIKIQFTTVHSQKYKEKKEDRITQAERWPVWHETTICLLERDESHMACDLFFFERYKWNFWMIFFFVLGS